MFTKIEFKGDQFELAQIIAKLEAARWPGSPDTHYTRLVGTLGEMAACIYLDQSSGRASTMPLGLVHRMGLVSDQELGRGDVCIVGKRKAARGRHNYPVEMLFSNMHEVKTTSAQNMRGMVKAEAVATYHDHNVSTIMLWYVRIREDRAVLVLDSMAAPSAIIQGWDLIDVNGVAYYFDPNIKRQQRHRASQTVTE